MASYNYMMSADEVAQELNCSKSHAYKLVKAMNKELSAQKNGQPSGLRQMSWVRRKNAESVDLKQSEKHWSLNEAKS